MKHTKGKWFWVGENLRTKQQDDKSWQGTLVFHHTASKEETKANRDLIASAPELLEEIKDVQKWILDFRNNVSIENAIKISNRSIRITELITKAEGNEKDK